jgi:hypothetical protein
MNNDLNHAIDQVSIIVFSDFFEGKKKSEVFYLKISMKILKLIHNK